MVVVVVESHPCLELREKILRCWNGSCSVVVVVVVVVV